MKAIPETITIVVVVVCRLVPASYAGSVAKEYDDACKAFLSSYMYQWEAMPLLSLLGQKQAIA